MSGAYDLINDTLRDLAADIGASFDDPGFDNLIDDLTHLVDEVFAGRLSAVPARWIVLDAGTVIANATAPRDAISLAQSRRALYKPEHRHDVVLLQAHRRDF